MITSISSVQRNPLRYRDLMDRGARELQKRWRQTNALSQRGYGTSCLSCVMLSKRSCRNVCRAERGGGGRRGLPASLREVLSSENESCFKKSVNFHEGIYPPPSLRERELRLLRRPRALEEPMLRNVRVHSATLRAVVQMTSYRGAQSTALFIHLSPAT